MTARSLLSLTVALLLTLGFATLTGLAITSLTGAEPLFKTVAISAKGWVGFGSVAALGLCLIWVFSDEVLNGTLLLGAVHIVAHYLLR